MRNDLCSPSAAIDILSYPSPTTPTNHIPGHEQFSNVAAELLQRLYPKTCPKCNIQLTKTISTRQYVIRCKQCHYQTSRFKGTPLAGLKIPLHIFGWALYESLQRYPRILNAAEIKRRTGVASNTATLIKRRLALLAADQLPKIKSLMFEEMKKNLGDITFPREDVDLAPYIQGKSIPQIDTCALFSTSFSANRFRRRYKHTGLTASIYTTSGEQKGLLVSSISWENGPILYNSIPDNTATSLRPILDQLPKNIPIFSDEGFKFYYRINKNHRMVNHSLKSKDKRYRFSRERWIRNSCHVQCVEGHNSLLKKNFLAAYNYVSPRFSQMYLDEYSFYRNVKYYGWNALLPENWSNGRVGVVSGLSSATHDAHELYHFRFYSAHTDRRFDQVSGYNVSTAHCREYAGHTIFQKSNRSFAHARAPDAVKRGR